MKYSKEAKTLRRKDGSGKRTAYHIIYLGFYPGTRRPLPYFASKGKKGANKDKIHLKCNLVSPVTTQSISLPFLPSRVVIFSIFPRWEGYSQYFHDGKAKK